jgi:predicted AAA+ superfamily ATPase
VGLQHLREYITQANLTKSELFYWDREKPSSTAEVDYVINADDRIIPIEVKAGKTCGLRSLQLFLNERNMILAFDYG